MAADHHMPPMPGGEGSAMPELSSAWARRITQACRIAAITGSLAFVLLVLMSLVSIVGRKLFAAPIPGDVELLQMCSACAAACFFAWCHLSGGDVKVDFFTARLSPAWNHRLDAVGSLMVALVGALLAWRSWAGAMTVRESMEVTMILDLPLWWGQVLMVPGLLLLVAAGGLRMGWHWTESRRLAATLHPRQGVAP
jgi:TRAP-type C4-dicarboxylate transport system permease small subunit